MGLNNVHVESQGEDEYMRDQKHLEFMRAALDMAEQALASDEVPVGCVFVHGGQIIGRGMNDTNRSLNVCTISSSSCCIGRICYPDMQ